MSTQVPWEFANFCSFPYYSTLLLSHESKPRAHITEAMSKKAFKSQASSSRVVSGAFGGDGAVLGNSAGTSVFGAVPSSPLSYVYEPPDLSGFSDPNVGVAFKNLQKKDGTTKAKALEDLQAYVALLGAKPGGVEEAVLMAWVGPPRRECASDLQYFDVA